MDSAFYLHRTPAMLSGAYARIHVSGRPKELVVYTPRLARSIGPNPRLPASSIYLYRQLHTRIGVQILLMLFSRLYTAVLPMQPLAQETRLAGKLLDLLRQLSRFNIPDLTDIVEAHALFLERRYSFLEPPLQIENLSRLTHGSCRFQCPSAFALSLMTTLSVELDIPRL